MKRFARSTASVSVATAALLATATLNAGSSWGEQSRAHKGSMAAHQMKHDDKRHDDKRHDNKHQQGQQGRSGGGHH
jgi:hypothetical protein